MRPACSSTLRRNLIRGPRWGNAYFWVGLLLPVLVTGAFALAIRAGDLTPAAYRLGLRPVSALIGTPNVFSVVVATLAGIVGGVSLTEARANALIGVFISGATIPAAADIGVSPAPPGWHQGGRAARAQTL